MARISGLPRTAARERASEALRHVGLYEERYRQIGGYSTGMKQRVKLAQALVHDPDLLLLDEPTNGLDPAGRDAMLGLIHRIGTEFGISVVVCSHLLGEVERICDSLVAIDGGRAAAGRPGRGDDHGAATCWWSRSPRAPTSWPPASTALGVAVRRAGRELLVPLDDDDTYDLILGAVAELGPAAAPAGPAPAPGRRAVRGRPGRPGRRARGVRPWHRMPERSGRRHPRHRLPALHRTAAGPPLRGRRAVRARPAHRVRARPQRQGEDLPVDRRRPGVRRGRGADRGAQPRPAGSSRSPTCSTSTGWRSRSCCSGRGRARAGLPGPARPGAAAVLLPAAAPQRLRAGQAGRD